MKKIKKIFFRMLSLSIIQWITVFFMFIYIWFVYFTSKIKFNKTDILKKYKKKSAIFVFWHGRSMMLSPIVRINGLKGYAIASKSKHGRLMARLQRVFGLKTIFGSSLGDGINALKKGIRVLNSKKNNVLCIAPDGPIGPSLRVKDGALYFAKITGFPIIPVSYSANKRWIQNRWDRYLVALPFSKIIFNVGEPIYIDKNITKEDFENKRIMLENIMLNQMNFLDKKFNIVNIQQDKIFHKD